ncbi:hypothetical protein L249_8211 [Ophiocordyceps polyrhachis-furcata BCC 54312]|uniref:Major facilitator superfamily (MFS) profile domain-containing protein n=1 Tax=Ophiocordyceps polyrhachis-furcata BCC 54312 TaxID=1330021 RepID=A0A367LH00_9HYPO|nr:hypothetical protein L249_8211 [Ophiocordyceps polyrhachis-furcata BCC 54312]
MSSEEDLKPPPSRWKSPRALARHLSSVWSGQNGSSTEKPARSKWSMGVLNDKQTDEVPGSVLLLASDRNEPLGLRNMHARTSHSSLPTGLSPSPGPNSRPQSGPALPRLPSQRQLEPIDEKKTTSDGAIILEPQPDDSANDPLNWPAWRRDTALLSLGFYCMIGGGITPLIAAGFTDVAADFHVDVEIVSLTTGLYMMGLGLGSVLASPTAILFGKRPVYLGSAIVFIVTCLWAAWSPSFSSLLAARVFQGVAISPVECLPSATIAEIFFLHERAYRIGIYTLLLLGGKNLVPLVSAAIISRFGWRWVFWIVAIVVGFGFVLLFLFVPETFWDRTPTKRTSTRGSLLRRLSSRLGVHKPDAPSVAGGKAVTRPSSPGAAARQSELRVGFSPDMRGPSEGGSGVQSPKTPDWVVPPPSTRPDESPQMPPASPYTHVSARGSALNVEYAAGGPNLDTEKIPASALKAPPKVQAYTYNLRRQPAQTFVQQLKPFHGRLNNDKWLKVMLRPFVLYAYPPVLWSAAVYSCSIGWLIVISETMAIIYRDPSIYNFSALQTGLVYISPFVGGILGTGVAGKVSDVIVRAMSRRNGGLYEPEFRLIMVIPVLVTTCIGLMGFGWSAQDKDPWIVPTVFFGVLSFGCSLGSTTSITYCVDSYRQYAGEALVTLNFSKNIFHGLIFSLFVANWMAKDGPRLVFIWLGVIQLLVLLTTIPMYIYGKRARMWTARRNLMERF